MLLEPRDDDRDENPLEPPVARLAEPTVCGLPAGAARRRHEARVRRELVTRAKAINAADLRLDEERADDADAWHRRELFHRGVPARGIGAGGTRFSDIRCPWMRFF